MLFINKFYVYICVFNNINHVKEDIHLKVEKDID